MANWTVDEEGRSVLAVMPKASQGTTDKAKGGWALLEPTLVTRFPKEVDGEVVLMPMPPVARVELLHMGSGIRNRITFSTKFGSFTHTWGVDGSKKSFSSVKVFRAFLDATYHGLGEEIISSLELTLNGRFS